MNGLIYTLPHASSFDIHKSNLHFPCSVPGKNLIVTTKRRLEYPEHINVPVQTVPQEDGEKIGLRVDNQAQLWPETSQCNLFSKHTGPVTRKVQQVETCKFEPTSLEATGCAYSTNLNVGTSWLNFTTAVSQYAGKTVGATHRLWTRLHTRTAQKQRICSYICVYIAHTHMHSTETTHMFIYMRVHCNTLLRGHDIPDKNA